MSNLMFSMPPLVNIPPHPPSQPCGAHATQPCLAPVPTVFQAPISSVVLRPEEPAAVSPAPTPSLRCSVKGCVFPVRIPGQTLCRNHELQESEAVLFQSHQPSHVLMLQAPFGLPDQEPDDSRLQDRKRQAAEREVFILDEPY